jgi:hypothetical protein
LEISELSQTNKSFSHYSVLLFMIVKETLSITVGSKQRSECWWYQVKAVGWTASMHTELREKVIKEASTLVPQLISITPLTLMFPLALASAIELFLPEHPNSFCPQDREREQVVELLLNHLKIVSTRIGETLHSTSSSSLFLHFQAVCSFSLYCDCLVAFVTLAFLLNQKSLCASASHVSWLTS